MKFLFYDDINGKQRNENDKKQIKQCYTVIGGGSFDVKLSNGVHLESSIASTFIHKFNFEH
jgi:hypothetical protein